MFPPPTDYMIYTKNTHVNALRERMCELTKSLLFLNVFVQPPSPVLNRRGGWGGAGDSPYRTFRGETGAQ